ncbi:MAG: GAF domain-containing protein [Cyanobacteria bacterium CRU_2_1]|nr:GAF domain-containing protein [Cyanobacteria bacterium CRU_2_1]
MVDSINTANCDAVQAVSQRVRLRYRLLQALPTVLIPLTILNAMNSQAFQVHAEVDSQFAVSATQEFSIASTDSSENSSDRAEASTNDSESALFFIAIVLLLSVSAITVVLSQARQLSAATRRAHLLAEISSARTFDEHDVEKVFDKALEEARQILGVSRVVIYRFKPDWSGYIFTESVVPGLPQAIEYPIEDPCIPNVLLEDYKNDRIAAVSDVSSAGFHPDHLQLMSRLHIKANLVVPILNNGQLFGLLIAHHCSKTHKWRTTEIAFLRQLAVQLGVTLDRVTFCKSARRKLLDRNR